MSDDDLERLHRRTEHAAWAFLILEAALVVMALRHDWPRWMVLLFIVPLLLAGLVCHVAMYPMRWTMDRRGINWDHP